MNVDSNDDIVTLKYDGSLDGMNKVEKPEVGTVKEIEFHPAVESAGFFVSYLNDDQLPDSLTNEPGSHGYFTCHIKTKPDHPEETDL